MTDTLTCEAAPTTTTEETARELHRSADTLIRAIYEKRTAWSALQAAYEHKVRGAYACVREDPGAGAAWQELLDRLGRTTPMRAIEPVVPYLGPQPGNTWLDALLQLALRHDDWLRPLEAWEPASPDPREQFADLVRHLLTCYEVPAFLDAAWFEGFGSEGHLHRHWFAHIGTGGNVRTAGGTVHLTKMAAHHFLQAPHDWPIVAALRWGQVLALGGDEHMARSIAASKLGRLLPDEPFWATVVHFFVNNPTMDRSQIGPIVDYLYYVRFGEESVRAGAGHQHFDDAPEPDLSMKGRTLPALLKRMEEWHEQLARDSRRPRTAWEPTGIEPFHLEERDEFGSLNTWGIVELLNSRALMEEGREMRHCVFTYAPQCLRGATSIWSLRVRAAGQGRMRRLLTIEVDNARRAIVQVRGRCNKALGAFHGRGRMKVAGDVLRRWARESRLSIHCAP